MHILTVTWDCLFFIYNSQLICFNSSLQNIHIASFLCTCYFAKLNVWIENISYISQVQARSYTTLLNRQQRIYNQCYFHIYVTLKDPKSQITFSAALRIRTIAPSPHLAGTASTKSTSDMEIVPSKLDSDIAANKDFWKFSMIIENIDITLIFFPV